MCKREAAYLSSRESLISIVTAHTRITVLLPLFIHTGLKKGDRRGEEIKSDFISYALHIN